MDSTSPFIFIFYFNICVFLMFCYSPLWPMAYSNPIFVCMVRFYVDFNIVILTCSSDGCTNLVFTNRKFCFTKFAACFDLLEMNFCLRINREYKKDKKQCPCNNLFYQKSQKSSGKKKKNKYLDNSGFVKNKICETIWWLDQMNQGHNIPKKGYILRFR
jgi:hypothetical protein